MEGGKNVLTALTELFYDYNIPKYKTTFRILGQRNGDEKWKKQQTEAC